MQRRLFKCFLSWVKKGTGKKSALLGFFFTCSAARLSIHFKKLKEKAAFLPRACRDEQTFGVFRENFIQPEVLHVSPGGVSAPLSGV